MAADNRVLRTVYVDRDVDDKLREAAAAFGLSEADLFRRYLNEGIRAERTSPNILDARSTRSDEPPVLRAVYLDAKLDDRLRVQAFDRRMSQSDVTLRYVRLGMNHARSRTTGGSD